jgi:hypothetical protein
MANEEVTVVDLAEIAGVSKETTANPIDGLISFDQLVMNFLQQYEDTKDEYRKLQEALDNMHYTSTITKISLEELQTKRDTLNKLSGAVEAMSLYKRHVDPNCTEREFTFQEDVPAPVEEALPASDEN